MYQFRCQEMRWSHPAGLHRFTAPTEGVNTTQPKKSALFIVPPCCNRLKIEATRRHFMKFCVYLWQLKTPSLRMYIVIFRLDTHSLDSFVGSQGAVVDEVLNTPPVLLPPSLLPATCCKLLICDCNQCDSYLLINMPVVHRIFPHVSLLTNASFPSCIAPLSISSLSFLVSFPLLSPSTLFSHFHGLILHANATPPLPPFTDRT